LPLSRLCLSQIKSGSLQKSYIEGRVMADRFAGKMLAKAAHIAALGVVTKEDLAGLVVFLASPAAAKITGQAISMTGGISAL
jgi:2-hydroxycyclohexanecarboxyl-CoA dehydrogenase